MKSAIIVILAAILGGCALVTQRQAKQEYLDSTEAYKACLATNQAAPARCEAQRLAMEADERKMVNTRAPGSPPITVIAPH